MASDLFDLPEPQTGTDTTTVMITGTEVMSRSVKLLSIARIFSVPGKF